MTANEARTLARATFGPSVTVMHAASDDGRSMGDSLYDLHAASQHALDMKLAALQGALRAKGWLE